MTEEFSEKTRSGRSQGPDVRPEKKFGTPYIIENSDHLTNLGAG